MFSESITVFNKYIDKKTKSATWHPHIIKGVELNTDKASIIAKYGENASDNATLLIHYTTDGTDRFIDGLQYKPSKEWNRDKDFTSVTFNEGADFFIVGEYATDEINDDDYTDGFYEYMNKTYDYCYLVSSVGIYKAIPHFEILAR